MRYKVLITADIDPSGIYYLKENGCEVINEAGEKLANVSDYVTDCDGILTRTEKIDEEVFRRATSLKVIGKHGVGVDNIDVKSATKHSVRVVNAPEANTDSVVEHTITLILALSKNIFLCDRSLRKGDYHSRDRIVSREVKNKTLGLVGLGRIGTRVGLKAFYGLDMKILVYDPYIDTDKIQKEFTLAESLQELFEKSDFISLHLPHVKQTRHLIDDLLLRKMKQDAFFINAARGPIVDEAALIGVLEQKKIAGAALDVFEEEPPEKSNKLFTLDNLIVTPHIAALTKEAKVNMSVHAARGIVEVLQGQDPTWPVN